MILVDSSVWISHFKHANLHLASVVVAGEILCHPLVIGEVSCGTPPSRKAVLSDLKMLDQVTVASMTEVLEFIESKRLFGRGCGFVDLSLLTSTMITQGAMLWTADKRLASIAAEMQVLYAPPLH